MSKEKFSNGLIILFAFIGIVLLVVTFFVMNAVHTKISFSANYWLWSPCLLYWSVFCLELWRHNGRQRYIYRWIDPYNGKEVKGIFPDSDTIFIRQKVSGWGGSSALIIPEPPAYIFPRATGWSLDQSSTIEKIVLVDNSGMKTAVASLESAIWLVSKRFSVLDAVECGRGDQARAEQFGTERDELIGAFLRLHQLVTDEKDTFGNSPYGVLTAQYIDHALSIVLCQDISNTKVLFKQSMGRWEHLADQCITRFGRR
jgi:hypothetical protein